MNSKIILLCLLAMMALPACGKQIERLPCESLLPETSHADLNRTLRLSAPPHINSFELSDTIYLVADNNSNSVIEVAPDRDMKVYWLRKNSWEPIRNKGDYLSVIDRLGPRTSDDPGGGVFPVDLDIPEQQDRVLVCVTVEGLHNSGAVAASIELVLHP